ncbi:MAG TPA: hypothetical protein VG406_16955 [Isosphaeraceae bacterium]|jgi:hypothetical protein|nr:hypothetical protein [Isosphaeraceae bacterium]
MHDELRPGRRSTDAVSNSDTRAFDRFEDEGGPGPEDARGQGRGTPTPAPAGDRDALDSGRIFVTPGSTAGACQVHHRDVPELHADGASPREAADNLAQDLAREIEGVADDYRRGLFGRILDDVRAFAAQGP